MSTAKTEVTPRLLEDFVEKHGYKNATFEPIEGGELSQAYLFKSSNGERVLRINHTNEGFLKDQYAAEHFVSSKVPIPKIENIGQLLSDTYFAISERAEGKVIEHFSKAEVHQLMPGIIEMVEAIHATEPLAEGYGWIRLNGEGKNSSWLEALDDMQESDDDHKLREIPYFDLDQYKKLRVEIRKYYQYCPEIRQLVHGDLTGNTLSDGNTITGVIDWHSAMYGDPMWDVAWLDFWGEDQEYAKAFRQYYEAQGRLPDYFDERLICYRLITAANSMAFFAKSDQPEKYKFAIKILSGTKRP